MSRKASNVYAHKEIRVDILQWLGPKIQGRMEELDISASMLARKTGIGVSTIFDYLKGKYDPSLSKIISIAEVLGVDWRFFFERDFGLPGGITTDGLVSYWSFDKDTIKDNIAEDVWGENNGNIFGDPETVEGKIGSSLKFDGNDYVVCGNDPSILLGNTDFSIALWFKVDEETGKSYPGSYLIGTYSLKNGKWYLLCVATGALIFAIDDNVTKTEINFPINASQWYYAVGVREKGKEIRLYVDGDLGVSTADQTETIDSDSPVYIGDRLAGERAFKGLIDEVTIYNRALSEDEIMQNYSAESNKFAILKSIRK